MELVCLYVFLIKIHRNTFHSTGLPGFHKIADLVLQVVCIYYIPLLTSHVVVQSQYLIVSLSTLYQLLKVETLGINCRVLASHVQF